MSKQLHADVDVGDDTKDDSDSTEVRMITEWNLGLYCTDEGVLNTAVETERLVDG